MFDELLSGHGHKTVLRQEKIKASNTGSRNINEFHM